MRNAIRQRTVGAAKLVPEQHGSRIGDAVSGNPIRRWRSKVCAWSGCNVPDHRMVTGVIPNPSCVQPGCIHGREHVENTEESRR